LGEEAAAAEHHKIADVKQAPRVFSTRAENGRTRIIMLAAPCGGNSPIARLLDVKTFATLSIITDFCDASLPFPPHDLILNAIGDPDHCGSSLAAAEKLLAQTTERVLNPPARIRPTGRADNAQLLRGLEGVVTPQIAVWSREALVARDAVPLLEQQGFTFPLLLRTPGFHGGAYFARVEKPDDLAGAVDRLPGSRQMVIQYLDARDDDGKIRKYRVMMIGDQLFPLHKAVSREWMIHYFSAEMAQSPEHRAEDEAFLEDMPGVLGARAMSALKRIRDALGLDYAGADFSLNREGDVLLFEANATMSVPFPEKGVDWDYRRGPVKKIHAAVREMVLSLARPRT
jgi:hypothetical protein